jgi:hypothetical protein
MSASAGTAPTAAGFFAPSDTHVAGRALSLRPFVEVLFQGDTAATTVGTGISPTWNEELMLRFRPPNDDFSPDSLQVSGFLYVSNVAF